MGKKVQISASNPLVNIQNSCPVVGQSTESLLLEQFGEFPTCIHP